MTFEKGTKVAWFPGRPGYDYDSRILEKLTGRVGVVESGPDQDNNYSIDFGPSMGSWRIHGLNMKTCNGAEVTASGQVIPT